MTCENATLPEILELSPRLEDADLDVGLGAFRQLQPGEFGADVGGDV
ncbi:hypothetical protein HKT47_28885, partial [Pseudomonas aeruginosa]|nr:hypothetical protein [Pseudomonas aeruginosa]